MRKPKIIINSQETKLLNPTFGIDAYEELKQIKANNEIEEYEYEDFMLPSGYKHVKCGDIIVLSYPEVDVYCEVRISILYSSGKQRLDLKYKDFVFKRS